MKNELANQIQQRQDVFNRVVDMLISSLELDRTPEEIDPDTPLFGTGLGLDSVDAVELVVQLDAVFGLTLAGSPWVSAKLRTVNTVVDAIMELRGEP